MWKVLVTLAAVSAVGCGRGPLCTDAAVENAFLSDCMNGSAGNGGGGTHAQCACAFGELADKYECRDFGNATVSELQAIVSRCQ